MNRGILQSVDPEVAKAIQAEMDRESYIEQRPVGWLEATGLGLGDPTGLLAAETELDGIVTIVLDCLNL